MTTRPITRPISPPLVTGPDALRRFAAIEEGGGSAYLDGVLASTCCDLDATIADSYGGSGDTWANLIASPACGAAQAGYDFWLGSDGTTDGSEPTFTGTPGDSGAYFDLLSGQRFRSKDITAMTGLRNAHRSDVAGFWAAIAFFHVSGSRNAIWGNARNAAQNGVALYWDPVYFIQSNGAGYTEATGGANMPEGADTLLIASWDGTSGTNNVKMWCNSTTANVHSDPFLASSTTPSTDEFYVGAYADGINNQPAGSRIYHFSCGNEFLDDAKAASIIAHLNTRHGRTYASV